MDNELIDALPGLDKAAILFQILGESLALTMFQDISESDIFSNERSTQKTNDSNKSSNKDMSKIVKNKLQGEYG